MDRPRNGPVHCRSRDFIVNKAVAWSTDEPVAGPGEPITWRQLSNVGGLDIAQSLEPCVTTSPDLNQAVPSAPFPLADTHTSG